MKEIEPTLKDFFEQLYIAVWSSECSNQMMDRMKKIMLFICYLFSLLNNTKITAFKFDLAYYLDSAETTNEGLNTMANLGMTMMSRSVDRKKKQMSDAHKEYVENALEHHSENAFVLNVDNYHNIHVQRQPDTTKTFWTAHIVTILATPCPMPMISHNRIINLKI